MKTPHKLTSNMSAIGTAVLAFILLATSSNAATVLINEDWENPEGDAGNNTWLDGTNDEFPGWVFNGSGNVFQLKIGADDGVPTTTNAIKMAWFGQTLRYDTGHAWSAGDSFTMSINATEQNWGSQTTDGGLTYSSTSNRNMVISLVETVGGTTVWSSTEQLVRDPDHDSNPEGWGANNTFNWTFDTDDFTGGTEGSALTFVLGGSGSRGYTFDNISLSVDAIPEPAATALFGLGGLTLILRRRRK